MTASNSETPNKLTSQLRRLIDQTTPGRPPLAAVGERRLQSRYARVLPVLVLPIYTGQPSIDEAVFTISRDLTDHGISLIQKGSLDCRDVVIGLWYASDDVSPYTNSPFFFVGVVRSNESIGGGFWQTGVEVSSQYTDPLYIDGLQVLAKGLIPFYLLNAEDRKLLTAGV